MRTMRSGLFAYLEACFCQFPNGEPPNVSAARQEADQLQQNYDAALQSFSPDASLLQRWEQDCQKTVAVLNRGFGEIVHMASEPKVLYLNWYQKVAVHAEILEPGPWDLPRQQTDALFFPGYHEKIYFCALSLDGKGLWNYGDYTLVLNNLHVQNRASLFIENTVLWWQDHGEPKALPQGFRATWADRHKLCTLKHAEHFGSTLDPDAFPSLLLKPGLSTAVDTFIEVHLYDTFNIAALTKVIVRKDKVDALDLKILTKKLSKHRVRMEVA